MLVAAKISQSRDPLAEDVKSVEVRGTPVHVPSHAAGAQTRRLAHRVNKP